MRWVVWLFLLFVVAVLSASTLGANDALVSIFLPPWRVDLSLNLFVLIVIGVALLVQGITRAITSLLDMPERARLWRERRREQAAQQALRDALIFLFAGRYSRSHKAAQRALDIQARSQSMSGDAQFAALLHLLAASSLHRLQDKPKRDAQLAEVSTWLASQTSGGAVGEGAALLAAEWAIDDRQGGRALEQLLALPAGVARRTLALRLRLQAARLARQPLEALRSARLLANHGGIPALAADGLLRSLAVEALGGARDIDQLRKIWLQLEASERRNPYVCAHAAERAAELDAPGDARAWLRPHWEGMARLGEREREAVARALVQALNGLPADWLPLLEAALTALPQDAAVAYAVGRALAQRQLWGRARRLLEGVARMPGAEPALRRDAWKALAAIAEEEGDTDRAAECYRSATLST